MLSNSSSLATVSSPSILAVVALYQCALSESESACSLFAILNEDAELARHFSLIVFDNSPIAQSPAMPAGIAAEYAHDATNGGLVAAYNYALQAAVRAGHAWLLLLDQDTQLTRAFLVELLEAAAQIAEDRRVAAIVPKLLVNGVIHSPAPPFVEQMRGQFGRRPGRVDASVLGIQHQPLFPYNSGAAVRISALQAVGGFPEEFWLDFLDHAVFQSFFSAGYYVYVLAASLTHDSSYADVCRLPVWRLQNVLMSQALFLKKWGTFPDRLLFRIWLLRHSRSLWRTCQERRLWKVALRQALVMSTRLHRDS